jgi:hypothetical protein
MIIVGQQSVFACYYGGQYFEPTFGNVNFLLGQNSQGGNYYYGLNGTISTTYPPDPHNSSHPSEHVNAFVMSLDDSSASFECCWAASGWFVGNNRLDQPRSSPTIYAELTDSTSSPYVLTISDPAPSSTYYQTSQNGYLGGGRYRQDAWFYSGGVWKFGGYAELTTATTRQDALGEATDRSPVPGDPTPACNRLSAAGGGNNLFASLQLSVPGSGWQWWRPSPEGRWADIDSMRPYTRQRITDFTDQGVGGP